MKLILAVLTLVSSQAVFAWGNTGHRVVGEVAQKYLNIETLVKVNKILKGQSMARVSTFPDDIKSDPSTYQHTFNWHYTTWPAGSHDHGAETEDNTSGFLLKSINEQLAILKDPASKEESREFALKFIIHLIGDLHMPFHVGNGTDQGGNYCKVTFHGKNYNLHSLWDEGMIDFTNLSFTELARFVKEGQTSEFARTGDPKTWAQESKDILATAYPEDVIPTTEPLSIRNYCKKEVKPEEMPKLAYEYSYKFMPVIEKRLFLAGVRLAHLLNTALK
jgi:hypothetical protein